MKRVHSSHLVQSLSKVDRRRALFYAGLTAVVGAIVIWAVFAAGTPTAFEAESGILANGAKTVATSGASGGSAVQFGSGATSTPTVTPTPTASPSGNEADSCTTQLVLPSATPTTSNTGIPSGTSLATYSGPTNITTAGTVINGAHITSPIVISANNVTIENSELNPPAGANSMDINIGNGVVGTKIIHNEITINGGNGGGNYEGVNDSNAGTATNYTFICGNVFQDFENDITIGANNIIQSNYIDQMDDNINSSKDCDADGIEDYWGGNDRIWGNYINAMPAPADSIGCINSALNITATGVNINDVQVNGNTFGGAHFGTVDLDQQTFNGGTGKATNVSITNNTWIGSSSASESGAGPFSDHASTIISTYSNNVWSIGGTAISEPN